MIERIKQAEAAIRSGDTKTGFEILRQVLAENPDSERAWWVMSGLVQRKQRAHCLEQVLRINPDNQLARETLEDIMKSVPSPEKAQEQVPAEEPAPDRRLVGNYLTWPYAQRSKIYLTLLGQEELISSTAEPKRLARVRSAIKEKNFTPALFKNMSRIPLENITSLRQVMSSLRVFFQVEKGEGTVRLELEDEAMADEVLAELLKRLGRGFSQTKEPMGIGSILAISAILILGAGGLTAFFFWGAQEVASGRAAATGSIRTRAIINLLEMLGPTGVAIIGGILILIALFISARLMFNPPMVTELKRIQQDSDKS
jgi:hypothetical protein